MVFTNFGDKGSTKVIQKHLPDVAKSVNMWSNLHTFTFPYLLDYPRMYHYLLFTNHTE